MNVPYTSGGTATTVKVESNGTVLATPAHQSSWVRLARALIDLYLEGEISTDDIAREATRWAVGADLRREERMGKEAYGLFCDAWLAWAEPSCPCDPYREKDCGHPARTENDVRNRLRQILAEDDMM